MYEAYLMNENPQKNLSGPTYKMGLVTMTTLTCRESMGTWPLVLYWDQAEAYLCRWLSPTRGKKSI